jgi:hypothetical protein
LSPIAIEVVRRIDALFEIERSINGKSAEERLAARRTLSRPLVDDLRAYMRAQLARLARGHDLVKAINYVTAQPALGASCRTERIDQDLRLLSDGLDYIPALLFGS